MNAGDPSVDDYWRHSPEWYRRRLVMQHELKHQAHGQKNYEAWKATLQAAERNLYESYASCLEAVKQVVMNGWLNFNASEKRDSGALHHGGQ